MPQNVVYIIVDTEPYIEELLSKIDDDAIRYNVKHFLITRRSLYIGDLLGKGNVLNNLEISLYLLYQYCKHKKEKK